MAKRFSMIREFHFADWFTLANAVSGMGAVLASMTYLETRDVLVTNGPFIRVKKAAIGSVMKAKGSATIDVVVTSAPWVDVTKVLEASPEKPAGEKQSRSKVPAGQVQATGDSPPEVTLAVIDAESAYVKKSAVARYAGLLDRLEEDCTEARAQLAEAALTASHDVESQTDEKLSILAVLREVVADNPSGQCAPAFQRVAERHGAE